MWRFPAERTIKSRSVAFQVETLCYNGQWACLFFVDCSLVRNSLFLYMKRCCAYRPRQSTSQYPASSFTPTLPHTRSRSSHTPTFFHHPHSFTHRTCLYPYTYTPTLHIRSTRTNSETQQQSCVSLLSSSPPFLPLDSLWQPPPRTELYRTELSTVSLLSRFTFLVC